MQTFIICVCCGQSKAHHAKRHCTNCYHKVFVRKSQNLSQESINSKISAALKVQRNKSSLIRSNLIEIKLKQLYCDQGLSMGDIAKQFNCSRSYILLLLRKFNLQVRNKSLARAQAKINGKNVGFSEINENFFKNQSPEMAYVLGFIYSDGNIGNQLNHFSISQKEPEILYKIKAIMSSEHQIVLKSSQNLHVLTIGNKVMVNDLISLGLTPNKSLDVKFPILREDLYSHFIRGYFDGDGCITKSKYWRVKYVSGSRGFLEGLEKTLLKYANVRPRIIYSHGPNSHELVYLSRTDISNIFKYFYNEMVITSGLFLERKYKLFVMAT